MAIRTGTVHGKTWRWWNIKANGHRTSGWQRKLLRRWPIRLFFFFCFLCLIALALVLPLACTTVVVPPAHQADPVTVYLIDYGRTSGLVLPTPNGGMTDYVYGNWDWYVLGRQGVRDALRAAWPSPAALGRHRIAEARDEAGVRKHFAGWSQHVYPIAVSRDRAARLERRLDGIFEQRIATRHVNEVYGLEFVRDEQAYHLFHTSNRVTAGWLEELGCRVRGPAIYARWEVKVATQSPGKK